MFLRASRGAFLRKKKPRYRGVLAVSLMTLAAAAFLYIFRPPPQAPSARVLFAAELSEYYCQDQTARADLTEIARHGLPAFARLARMDENGTWSLIYIGPFEDKNQASAATDFLRGRGLYNGKIEIKTEPAALTPPAGPVVIELSPFLNDEALFEELALASARHVYALARTVEVDQDNGQAWNHIYLGPFSGLKEAEEALSRLQNWDLAHDYLVLPIDLGGDDIKKGGF